jgi:MinD-like ATPase involved in chromosome partitioning or flagellar assembly
MLNPSNVEVAAPAPVIFRPTYMLLVTDIPPERTTDAVVKLEASVTFVIVVRPEAVRVVNAAVLGLAEPMLELVIVLLLIVSELDNVARVPVVGRVTLVAAVVVNVRAYAPAVVNAPAVLMLPPRVIV